MASPTKQVKLKRKKRNSKMGKKRKAEARREGTYKTDKELFGD